jgi:L-alanine-DL-glutamate epimerase-like enolase superfamily enzyme
MKIVDVRAYPTSFPVPPEARVSLGIGTAVKRDAVVVKVTTDEGLVGWGESHHGRSPGPLPITPIPRSSSSSWEWTPPT